jgi:hypothetical protein
VSFVIAGFERERFQRLANCIDSGQGRRLDLRLHSPHGSGAVSASIASTWRAASSPTRRAYSFRAGQAEFLVREQHDADRSCRLALQSADEPRRLDDDCDAGAIIDRALPEIP